MYFIWKEWAFLNFIFGSMYFSWSIVYASVENPMNGSTVVGIFSVEL